MNLQPNERILHKETPHWIYLSSSFSMACFGFMCVLPAIFPKPLRSDLDPARLQFAEESAMFQASCGLILLFLACVMALHAFFNYRNFKFYITNKRLLIEKGVLNVYYTEIPLNHVQTISVKQSLFGRLFRFGDLVIGDPKSGERIKSISDPHKVRERIKQNISTTSNYRP